MTEPNYVPFLAWAQLGNCGTPLSGPEVGPAPICNCPYRGRWWAV